MVKPTTYSALAPTIVKRWRSAQILKSKLGAVDRVVATILKNRARYEAAEELTGVPWPLIAVKHYREASNDFRGVMHNGQKIVGTNRITTIVPVGRGPFATWEDSAVDAFNITGLSKVKTWPIERVLYEGEKFNGFGYSRVGLPSAYVWAGTDQYVKGKYVSDGKFDPNAVDQQLGIALILKRLEDHGISAVRGAKAVGPVVATEEDRRPAQKIEDVVNAPIIAPTNTPPVVAPASPVTEAEIEDAKRRRIKKVQEELRRVGLHIVGFPDGLMGPNTIAAIAAFRQRYNISTTADGVIDDQLEKFLAAAPDNEFQPSPERRNATPEEINKKSEPIREVKEQTFWAKIHAAWISVVATIKLGWDYIVQAIFGVAGAVDESSDQVQSFGSKVMTFFGSIPNWVLPVAIIIGAFLIWRRTRGADLKADKGYQEGKIVA